MFALFYELEDGAMQFITTCEDRGEARILGKMFSRYRELPVVAVINPPSGETAGYYRFENGRAMTLNRSHRPGVPAAAARLAGIARAAQTTPRSMRH